MSIGSSITQISAVKVTGTGRHRLVLRPGACTVGPWPQWYVISATPSTIAVVGVTSRTGR
ncbi:MAG: hypothetical protein R2711_04875 [Acidimicrobiales bacterium]